MKSYLNSLIGGLMMLLLAIAAVNHYVNPYGIFPDDTFSGSVQEKPEARTRQRMSKAYQVAHIKPDAIILGTSRALALDENHPHWRHTLAYNLALTSSSIYEQWRYLQHAQAVKPLKEVVIGLDYFMFHAGVEPTFNERRLLVDRYNRKQYLLAGYEITDLMSSLASSDALISTLVTIDQGDVLLSKAEERKKRIAANGGHRKMFVQMEKRLFRKSSTGGCHTKASEIGSYDLPGSFRKMLRFAHINHIQLILFISPSHARMWEAWRILGCWPAIEEWKRELVKANEDEARLAMSRAFPIWDFSGYNSITTERLPTADETDAVMFGYWEDSHYSESVGTMILDHIFTPQNKKSVVSDEFGALISSRNIELHLQQIRSKGIRYRQDNTAEIDAMEDMYNSMLQ